jgi:hypothetical protein
MATVYCEHGFGPLAPWGLIFLDEETPSTGQEFCWFPTFRKSATDLLNIRPERLML